MSQWSISLSDEPSGGVSAFMHIQADTNLEAQEVGFELDLPENVYAEMCVRQYVDTGEEYTNVVAWTTINTSGAQQFMVPINKAYVKAGGPTILQMTFRTVGSVNIGTGVATQWKNYWTYLSHYVSQTHIATICEEKDNYRFGFNGMEKDNEAKGIGNSLDFGARIYDSRLGKFLSRDPLAKNFPSESNYSFAGNSPIYLVDKDGKYKVAAENEANYTKNYPLIMKYLSTQIESDISNSTKIVNGLVSTNPNIKPSSVKGIAKWGFGPEIVFKDAPGEFPMEYKGAAGYTLKDAHVIQMNAGYARYVEKVLASDAKPEVKQAVFTRFYMTLIHETGHELNKYGKPMGQNEQGYETYESMPNGYSTDEQGYKAEQNIWGTDTYKPFSNPSMDDSEGVEGITSDKYKEGVTEGVIKEANKTEEGKKSLPTVPTN